MPKNNCGQKEKPLAGMIMHILFDQLIVWIEMQDMIQQKNSKTPLDFISSPNSIRYVDVKQGIEK